jgi:hypothetical protein
MGPLLTNSALFAQQAPPKGYEDAHVIRVLTLALDNIQRARCENNAHCAAATAEERKQPPLSIAEGRSIMQRGVLSGLAQHCGLDWRTRNFLPMMAHWRLGTKKSARQMALVGLVHGIMQGQIQNAAAKQGACSDQMRQSIDVQLTFRA